MISLARTCASITTLLAAAIVSAASSIPLQAAGPAQEIRIKNPAAAADLQSSALEAVGEDQAGGAGTQRVAAAIKVLRDAGPAGLDALFQAHGPAISEAMRVQRVADAAGKLSAVPPTPAQLCLRAAIDAVAMQRDAIASHLYWYTDLAAAKAEAQRTGKAILSLRMLGNLNDDLSCANSRFFRTTLYSNAAVSTYLREHFILHWESVRPVPVITIDMGDGRKIVRTITGNSIHYVLDARGRVVDALPGLYGAEAFLNDLQQSADFAAAAADTSDELFSRQVAEQSLRRLLAINAAWNVDLGKVGVNISPAAPQAVAPVAGEGKPTAVQAGRLAFGKGKVETPILAQIMPDGQQLEKATTNDVWQKIAALHSADATLDAGAKALIALKNPDAAAAMPLAISKRIVETPMLKMIRNLQDSIALDTVKNEYQLHAKICQWLAAADKPVALATFNERVYAELFLTPNSDPWVGLAPADTFAGLDNQGICPTAIAAH